MAEEELTCWTLILNAATGEKVAQEAFARRYLSVVRQSLVARWRRGQFKEYVDDAVQEVFVDCFKRGGALSRLDRACAPGFRGFLYGIVRNVALRIETRRRTRKDSAPVLDDLPARDERLSRTFDRAWASGLVREAGRRHRQQAHAGDAAALRRWELLQLRFDEDLPIREIAEMWEMDAAVVHKQFRRARLEFLACLREVVAFDHPHVATDKLDAECRRVLELLEH